MPRTLLSFADVDAVGAPGFLPGARGRERSADSLPDADAEGSFSLPTDAAEEATEMRRALVRAADEADVLSSDRSIGVSFSERIETRIMLPPALARLGSCAVASLATLPVLLTDKRRAVSGVRVDARALVGVEGVRELASMLRRGAAAMGRAEALLVLVLLCAIDWRRAVGRAVGGPMTAEATEDALVLSSLVAAAERGAGASGTCTEIRRGLTPETLRGSAAGVTGAATLGMLIRLLRFSKLNSCCFAELCEKKVSQLLHPSTHAPRTHRAIE